ncbi:MULTISPECIES: YqiA/YcfP family alpha/beta fold hydrolase [Thalassolituus]|uniref:YqiA/YcfP family alpha/beta fold hydrolase n=1 Tax=Thalassolituus TaxID=187492 RepID=UPI001E2AC3EE|nr:MULTISPECIES: YqiA/YcfP family alpha/beta fold hydrolase [Thalassolituus]MCB2386014.1 esterase [Thalassolituus alkanivorans]MCB2422641.1 esterase [Thalassolituus alkanivorans]
MYSPSIGCLYLHGFLSSPQSLKAQQLLRFYETHLTPQQLVIPTLPFAPADAIELARAELKRLRQDFAQVYIIGSSLGGFYATHLAETEGVPAVLVNPAVRPFDLFEHYLGPNTHYYSGEVHELTHEHIGQLRALDCAQIQHPERLLLLLQTGDETLDYRLAAELYRNSPAWLEGGGNHSFERFIERMPMLLAFAARFHC